jgi:hypothetical protein
MMMIKKIHTYLLLAFLGISLLKSFGVVPEGPLPDAVFDRNIRTVRFFKEGWEFGYPILEQESNKPLILQFDVLNNDYKSYSYSVIHCDADWMPSRISYTEYMEGFYQNSLLDYKNSFSTYVPYQHYELKLPNENIQLKLSGNYVVMVYEAGKEDQPLIMKRFTLVNRKVEIEGRVKRPTLTRFQDEYQEVDFTILHPDYPIDNPHRTIKVVIVKNNQWKLSIRDLKPLFIRDKEIVYDLEEKNLFPGGNEYRSFDTKSVKYQLRNIAYMGFRNNRYEVDLATDKSRANTPYFTMDDLNGKYSIENQQGSEPNTDADYMYVKFTLHSFEEITKGNVYVYGAFTDFNTYDDCKMSYNAESGNYELEYLVKQGYCNYQYVFKPNASDDIDETLLEGSFSETENDYVIYVYYRPFGSRVDALIGYKVLNSKVLNN